MIAISSMPIIITVILLICGYLAMIQAVNAVSRRSRYSSGNTVLIDVVVAVMYSIVCGIVGLLYIYSGCDMLIIYAALGLGVLAAIICFIRFCVQNRYSMKTVNVILFLVYFAVVLYLTIFMRIGTVDTSIVTTPFDDLKNAIQYRDPAMVQHMVLNVLMFVPFGYLIPAMNPESIRRCSFAFLGGIVCSTVIEGAQMIFSLGQSDIDDIIANSIGAVIGYLLVRFVWQFRKNWRL
ncbi:MAG: VanZ family protein [Blautia sp.]|nr:VanZ family protein [Blautia sp.]